jgi:hypothetical protein
VALGGAGSMAGGRRRVGGPTELYRLGLGLSAGKG